MSISRTGGASLTKTLAILWRLDRQRLFIPKIILPTRGSSGASMGGQKESMLVGLVAAADSLAWASARFVIYAGPKLYHRLAQLPHNEAEVMDFGIFKLVCQFLLNFMNLLHSWMRDYGLAILALTTIIKLTLWPIQNRANRSMRQMAALSPKMQELKEKYKDDPTRMNQEVMKLYKQYGIN